MTFSLSNTGNCYEFESLSRSFLLQAKPLKCHISYCCTAVDKISTDIALRAVPLWLRSFSVSVVLSFAFALFIANFVCSFSEFPSTASLSLSVAYLLLTFCFLIAYIIYRDIFSLLLFCFPCSFLISVSYHTQSMLQSRNIVKQHCHFIFSTILTKSVIFLLLNRHTLHKDEFSNRCAISIIVTFTK